MIDVSNVYFSYTNKSFIEGISFKVSKGEIFGFLGPSGAGKSTLQKILIGMITDYTGHVKINNTEVRDYDASLYEMIGIDFEFPSLYEKLTARQNLAFFGSLYSKQPDNIDTLLDAVGLLQDANKKVSGYSKGMKSRLNFIKALLHDPDILFLDEPTSGLDPTNSRIMKYIILEEKKKGKTIILTTHNMQDATELCDQVAFIVAGKVRALDTPHNLIMQRGARTLTYSYIQHDKEISHTCLLDEVANDKTLQHLIATNQLLTIHSSEPTLGDIFIDITGRQLS